MDCSDNADPLISAMHKLASQNGFTIHNVPYGGDCMFSAILYQLSSTGVCDLDSKILR